MTHNEKKAIAQDTDGKKNDGGDNSRDGGSGRKSLPTRVARLAWRAVWTLTKALLYTAFIAATVVLILLGLEWSAEHVLRANGYGDIYPKDFAMVKKDYTRPVTHYDYDLQPGVCLIYDVSKGNSLEYANNAGFREPRDIPLDKPADEFRIFLTGGSTAFGLGPTGEVLPLVGPYTIEYRETISHIMEKILNATCPIPGKKIRVYNAAVWGYAYQHHLFRYIVKLRRYKPDLIISLDGANEIPLASKISFDWDYFKEGQYSNIIRRIFSYDWPGLSSYMTLWLKNNTYTMTAVWAGRDTVQEISGELLAKTDSWEALGSDPRLRKLSVEERSRLIDRNVSEIVNVVEKYHLAMASDGVPHIMALQPWLYLTKKNFTDKEKAVLGVHGAKFYYGVPSADMYQLIAQKLAESANRSQYFLVDFSRYFDDVSEWVFTDWCHLTAGANYVIAKELSNLVKEHFFRKPLSDGDRIEDKNLFFWDFAAGGKIVYAPPPDSPENDTGNILHGYPSHRLYSSRKTSGKERLELVLDLKRVLPVGRTRIVWAEKESVPKKWVIETSMDSKEWTPFASSETTEIDSFSLWPGMEFYAGEPVKARYLRYRPAGGSQERIRMRLWSVGR